MTTISRLATSFARTQKAEGKSPHTIKLYGDCILRLIRWCEDDPSNLTRRNLTDFYAVRAETVAPATVWTDWKVHRVFLQWLVDEEELTSHPMARMKAPRQPSRPVPVLSEQDIARLLAACSGRLRRDKRDLAIIRLALDTGARRGELAGLTVADLDLDENVVRLTGKGKTRIVPFGSKTAMVLDRHMRANSPTGSLFGLTPSGMSQMFKERARAASLPAAHFHMTRHTVAHRWMAAGGSET
ncbi:MAG TPA: tyrosine-type recombinase/integrase, partial [Candidatus Limnocylindrales bacterium]